MSAAFDFFFNQSRRVQRSIKRMKVNSDFAKSILKRYVVEDTITTSDQDASPNSQEANQGAKKTTPHFKQFPSGGPVVGLLVDNDSGYNAFITHLDKSPILTKVLSFLYRFVFFAICGAILIWRIQSSPYYFVDSSIDLEIPKLHSNAAWYSKPLHLAIDNLTWKYIWPPFWNFVFGELKFRLRFGFRQTEIIFREPECWLGFKALPADRKYGACWNNFHSALHPYFVYKTPARLSSVNGTWLLNYNATYDAHDRVKSRKIPAKTWDFSAWLFDGHNWFVWRLWKIYDRETIRKGTIIFQNKLEALGKTSLFEQWKMMMEDDPDGTPLQGKNFNAIQEVFKTAGIDYGLTWHEIFAYLDSVTSIHEENFDPEILRRQIHGEDIKIVEFRWWDYILFPSLLLLSVASPALVRYGFPWLYSRGRKLLYRT